MSAGLPLIRPLSLRKAIRLPLKVTAPTSTDRKAVTPASAPRSSPGVPARPGSTISSHRIEQATSAEAPPPKPLNRATISGIAVISTLSAATVPTRPPTMRPVMIQR